MHILKYLLQQLSRWETLAAGDALRPESPPASSVLGFKLNVHNASDVLGCKPNVNNSDPFKCSQNKILSDYGKGNDNVNASNQCRLKTLQKNVKKASGSSRPTGNQGRAESIGGVPESSTGSTASELDQSSVPSSPPSCNSLESVNTSILLEIPALSKSSAQKHVRSTQPQVEATDRSILGEKYVKKANTTFCSASNQVDSVRVPGFPKGSTKTKVDQSSVASSSSSSDFVIPKEAKAENLGQPESSTVSHSSAKKSVASAYLHRVRAPHESIFVKKPNISVEHASRNGTHGFNVSTVHSHPASQQSKCSEAQNKIYPYSTMGGSSGKLSNGYKLNQQQMYVKKVDVLSGSTSNVIGPVNGFPDNPGGSPSSHPSQSMLACSISKTLHTAKLNQ